jgi:hypothetical protein
MGDSVKEYYISIEYREFIHNNKKSVCDRQNKKIKKVCKIGVIYKAKWSLTLHEVHELFVYEWLV